MSNNLTVEQSALKLVEILKESESKQQWNQLSDQSLQELIALIIKAYVAKKQGRSTAEERALEPLMSDHNLTQTEVMTFLDKLLSSMELDLFEVQFFRNFCRNL